MRNRTVRISLAVSVLLGVFALMLSCGDTRPTNLVNSNSALQAESALTASKTPRPNACGNAPDNGEKIRRLKEDLKKLGLETDEDLEDQLIKEPGEPGNFSISFEEYPADSTPKVILMRVKGKVIGDENPHNPKLKATKLTKLLRFLDVNMRKGCIDGVSFEPIVTGVRSTETGFEWWGACEHPNEICQDGVCRRDCSGYPLATPTPGATATPAPTGSPSPAPSPTPTP